MKNNISDKIRTKFKPIWGMQFTGDFYVDLAMKESSNQELQKKQEEIKKKFQCRLDTEHAKLRKNQDKCKKYIDDFIKITKQEAQKQNSDIDGVKQEAEDFVQNFQYDLNQDIAMLGEQNNIEM